MKNAIDFANNKNQKIVYPAWAALVIVVAVFVALAVFARIAWAEEYTQAPDGSYVASSDGTVSQAPDGSWHGGDSFSFSQTPDGAWHGAED